MLNVKRLIVMILFNIGIGVPLSAVFYRKLAQVIQIPGWQGIAVKLLIDVTLFSSVLNTLYLFIVASSKNNDVSDGLKSVKRQYWDTMKFTWKIWPIVSLINFKFFQADTQVIVNNIVALFFGLYLSILQTQL